MGANEGLGEKIKHYRHVLKMTQADFAKRLGVTGASVSAYENGIRQPSFSILVKIAGILNTTTDDLLGRVPNTQKSIDVSSLTGFQVNILKDLAVSFTRHNEMVRLASKQKELDEQLKELLEDEL